MTNPSLTILSKSPVIKPEDVTLDDLNHLSKDNFALWALTSGAKVDRNDVDFNKHRYLLPIYLNNDKEIVWMKAAQLGATVYMLLRILWWLEKNPGRKAGLYFPTKDGVDNLSKDRLTPLIQSCPSIASIADHHDKLGLRKIGASSFYLFHLGGVASKDSVPLDFVAFDEVRLCSPADIDQALERLSHSEHKYKIFMSTAGIPDTSIAARFDLGTRHIWRSKCTPSICPDGIDLARTFPDCVVEDKTKGLLYLRCPKCKATIKDPQNGRFVPENNGAEYISYNVSQLVSKFISLKEIWDFYKRTTNKEEFYNAKLGLPFVDEQNRGVTKDQLDACVDTTLEWARPSKTKHTAMGVDQGGGYNYVVIADIQDGKKRIRHLEIIEQDNPLYMEAGHKVSPFKRLYDLMKEFDVRVCVIDGMPNFNEALAFAQAFPGRVFIAWYQQNAKDVVQWGDKKRGAKEVVRKAGPLLKFKYHCILSRYTSINLMLGEFAQQNFIMPDPDRLIQLCKDEKTGQIHTEAIARRFQNMMMRLIKRFHVTNEETGEGRYEFIYGGADPHFSHAATYCNAALERLRRQNVWVFA